MQATHLPIGLPSGYGDSHGIPLLAADTVSGKGKLSAVGSGRGRCCAASSPHWNRVGLAPCPALKRQCAALHAAADMEKKGLRDQLEAQAREIQRLQGEQRCVW